MPYITQHFNPSKEVEWTFGMLNHSSRSGPLVGYVVKIFPKLSETFILQEILELEARGLRIVIFSLNSPTDADTHPHVRQLRAPILYAPQASQEQADLSSQWASWISKQCRIYGIEHLHAHFATEPTTVVEQVSRQTGIGYSFTTHAKDLFLSDHESLSRKTEHAQFVLTCTQYNQVYLQKTISSSTPIFCVYHGIDLEWFHPSPTNDAPPPSDIPLILSIGRFREKKGFPTLIQACAGLQATGLPFRCVIIGYGPMQTELEAAIRHHRLQNHVWLVGKMTRERVREWYEQASLFVLPCQIAEDGDRDGIPNVLVEAMAMGLPVVSTSVASIPELITDQFSGLLVPPHQPHLLGIAIATLIQHPKLRKRLGHQARQQVIRHFNATRNTQTIFSLLSTRSHQEMRAISH